MTLSNLSWKGAKVQGRDHRRLLRDGQDGLAAHDGPDGLALAVTDGCGSAECSEVGARLAAAWLAVHAPRCLVREPTAFGEHLSAQLLGFLASVASSLESCPEQRPHVVGDMFLFSFVCAVITADRVVVVGRGDGFVEHNGARPPFSAGEANTPDYLGYELLGAAGDARLDADVSWGTHVLVDASTRELDSLVLATDGLAPLADDPEALAELRDGAIRAKSPTWLVRKLRVLADHGPLRDDTAMFALGRRGA